MELLDACKNNNQQLALLLIKFSKEMKISSAIMQAVCDENDSTILMWAISNDMLDVSLALINNDMYDVNHVNKCKLTALMYICRKPDVRHYSFPWNNVAVKLISKMNDYAL